jgi:hypothetical protein
MTREEIDIMWQQALRDSVRDGEMFTRYHFAKMIAAKEREANVNVCREIYSAWMCETDEDVDAPTPNDCIRAIKARGESWTS